MAVNQVVWNWSINGQTINNVMYFDIPAGTPEVRTNFADAVRSFVDITIKGELSPSCSLNSLTLREMDGGPAVSFDVPFTNGPLVGTSNSSLADITSPLQVYYRSQTAKPNRGWAKYSGLTEDGWAGTNWNQGVVDAFNALYTVFTQGFSIAAGDCILGICRPDFPNNSVIAFNVISSFVVRPYTRKQTSRRPQDI